MAKNNKNNILDSLNDLSQTDVYSLLLFALWKIREIPEYSTLSELSYILDNNSLLRFLDYYGGSTIKIPTKEEFRYLIEALTLYKYVNIEEVSFEEALNRLDVKELSIKEIKNYYQKLDTILTKYDFRRK